jgi:hypothetical protein
MSDADLDREFEATQKALRPQSQIARAFADQLNDIFLLDDSLDKLDRNVNRKYAPLCCYPYSPAADQLTIGAGNRVCHISLPSWPC